jgi:uncharacterized protein (UPF0332 family)
MDPREFISLAIRLSSSRRESDLRTTVSRAYYGAYHVACELLETCGVVFSGKELYGAEVHRKVRFCLRESGSHDAAKAGEKLGSLRDERNQADYDLKLQKFDGPTVALLLHSTHEIVDALERCRQDPEFAAIRDKMRMYARDVLRLSLAGE